MKSFTPEPEKVRLERRKGITFNYELHKKKGYPIYLRITEDGRHKIY